MSKLRKPTEWHRRLLKQELALVLGQEPEADSIEGCRQVQLLIPESPQVFVSIDKPTPLVAGPDRTYNIPPAPPNTSLPFKLQPEQVIYACVAEGYALLGIIVEYLED